MKPSLSAEWDIVSDHSSSSGSGSASGSSSDSESMVQVTHGEAQWDGSDSDDSTATRNSGRSGANKLQLPPKLVAATTRMDTNALQELASSVSGHSALAAPLLTSSFVEPLLLQPLQPNRDEEFTFHIGSRVEIGDQEHFSPLAPHTPTPAAPAVTAANDALAAALPLVATTTTPALPDTSVQIPPNSLSFAQLNSDTPPPQLPLRVQPPPLPLPSASIKDKGLPPRFSIEPASGNGSSSTSLFGMSSPLPIASSKFILRPASSSTTHAFLPERSFSSTAPLLQQASLSPSSASSSVSSSSDARSDHSSDIESGEPQCCGPSVASGSGGGGGFRSGGGGGGALGNKSSLTQPPLFSPKACFCCQLSWKQRVIGFGISFGLASALFLLSFLSLGRVVLATPLAFAICYVCSNLAFMISSCFLIGPRKSSQSLLHRSRLPLACTYLGLLFLLLWLGVRSSPAAVAAAGTTLQLASGTSSASSSAADSWMLVVAVWLLHLAAASWYAIMYLPLSRAVFARAVALADKEQHSTSSIQLAGHGTAAFDSSSCHAACANNTGDNAV